MQSTLKKIGNSFGVIINKKLLEKAGIDNKIEISIQAIENSIVISPVKGRKPLNRDVSTWRKQMKEAIKKGQKPEKSVWKNKLTKVEEKEWTW